MSRETLAPKASVYTIPPGRQVPRLPKLGGVPYSFLYSTSGAGRPVNFLTGGLGMPTVLYPVRQEGLEPSRPCGHTDLNRARLPIPTLTHVSVAIPVSTEGISWT